MWEEGTEGMKLKQYIIMLSDNIYIILFSKGR